MIWLMVTWLSWSCPGGPLSGIWPEPVRPVACKPVVHHEQYDPAQLPEAEERVRRLGPAAMLEECRLGRGCRTLSNWRTEVTWAL